MAGAGEAGEEGRGSADVAPLRGRRLGAAALLLAASVFLSRILGIVREAVLAAEVGVGSEMDAYRAAFQVPDILNYLLAGGALAIAFTPLYLRTRSLDGDERAAELFHTVLGTLGVIAVLLTAVVWWYADPLISAVFGSFDAETRSLTIRLTRIVLPAQIFFVTGGIVRAVLMAHGRFGAQAAAGLIYNGGIIAGGVLSGSIEGFAWGALVGAILGNWAFPLYDLRHVGNIGLRIAPFDPRFHAYLWQALPLMVGLSLTTVDEWYEKLFGQRAGEGVIAALGYARSLMMAPVAIIGQAVAAAALPTLAAFHAAGQERELNATLLRTLRVTLALAVLSAGAVFVLAEPIVEVVYHRGRFSQQDVTKVAALLSLLALAVPGWITQQVAVRAFFARSETWRPMLLGTGLVLLCLPFYYEMGDRFGAEGLAGAGVVSISVNAALTLLWSRRRHGGPPLASFFATGLRAVGVTVFAAVVASAARWAPLATDGLVAALCELATGSLAFAACWLLGMRLVGDELMREAVGSLLGRAGRSLRVNSRRAP